MEKAILTELIVYSIVQMIILIGILIYSILVLCKKADFTKKYLITNIIASIIIGMIEIIKFQGRYQGYVAKFGIIAPIIAIGASLVLFLSSMSNDKIEI